MQLLIAPHLNYDPNITRRTSDKCWQNLWRTNNSKNSAYVVAFNIVFYLFVTYGSTKSKSGGKTKDKKILLIKKKYVVLSTHSERQIYLWGCMSNNKLTRGQREAVALLSIGMFLEYFDLMLYIHMAVFLNEIFFSAG